MEFNVRDKFQPNKFADDVGADYLYSHNDGDDFYRLLNEDTFGHIKSEDVEKLIEHGHKVVVIENDALKAFTYNIDKYESQRAFMNHGKLKSKWDKVEKEYSEKQ